MGFFGPPPAPAPAPASIMTKVWPPSDESMPFLVAFLIGVFLLMYSIFFSSRKETKYVKEAKEEKRAKCAEASPRCC